MTLSHPQSGFTLIETIVVIAITALISVTLGVLLSYFYRTNAYTIEQATAVEQARKGIEDAMHHLREASYGSDGSYPVTSAATSSVTFYANIDSTPAIERVVYKLQSGTLYRVATAPTGNPLTYTGGTVSTSTIAKSIVNDNATAVFLYFDKDGNQLSSPVNISLIRSIRTTLMVDVNQGRSPTFFSLSASATVRNLRN